MAGHSRVNRSRIVNVRMKVGADVSAANQSRWKPPCLGDLNDCYQRGLAVFEGVVDTRLDVFAVEGFLLQPSSGALR
jgi:hypothetical protein